MLGIKLLTVEQLVKALTVSDELYYTAQHLAFASGFEVTTSTTATSMYRAILSVISSSSSNISGTDSSSHGRSSNQVGSGFAPHCGPAVGYDIMCVFINTLVVMTEWEGPLTKAAAQADVEAVLRPGSVNTASGSTSMPGLLQQQQQQHRQFHTKYTVGGFNTGCCRHHSFCPFESS